ncbi:hypothetical protein BaRGS_00004106, partial [Batillaria attramentaria]
SMGRIRCHDGAQSVILLSGCRHWVRVKLEMTRAMLKNHEHLCGHLEAALRTTRSSFYGGTDIRLVAPLGTEAARHAPAPRPWRM